MINISTIAYISMIGFLVLFIGITSIPLNKQWERDLEKELKEANR